MIFLRRSRHVASIVTLMAVFATVVLAAQSQPSKTPEPPQTTEGSRTANTRQPKRTTNDQSPTQSPINVTVTAPEPSPEALAADRQQREREIAIQESIRSFTGWLVVISAVQGLITAGALFAAIRAANAAKRSADIADKTLTLTQRSYLQPVNWTLTDLVADRIPRVTFKIKYLGHTPARILTSASASIYSVERPGQPPDLAITDEGGLFLGAGATLGKHVDVHPPLNAANIDGLNAGTLSWWIYVRFTYLDAFDRNVKVFQTCMRYSHRQRALVSAPDAGYEQSD